MLVCVHVYSHTCALRGAGERSGFLQKVNNVIVDLISKF